MAPAQLLGKVEDVFEIRGRGTVVTPIWLSNLEVRSGDPIELRTSDGRVQKTRIAAVEFTYRGPGAGCRTAFILARDIAKQDVDLGSEIWLPDLNK